MAAVPQQQRFVFAVPLKPRSACADWELVQSNLRRTARSALASGAAARRPDVPVSVVVACHDEPDVADLAVDVVRVPFPGPSAPAEGGRDKAAQRRHIGAWLRQRPRGATWVMFLDADDVVHRDLVRHVLTSELPSHLVDQGYVFDAGARLLFRRRQRFHVTCGSSFVCRFDDDELPSSWDDVSAPFSQFGSSPEHRGHQEYDLVASELGRPPAAVPFPAVVYIINHSESLWAVEFGGTRGLRDPRDLVPAARARQLLADDFASPDLAAALAGGAAALRARLTTTPGALRDALRRRTAAGRRLGRRG